MNKKFVVYVVRHGEKASSEDDAALTERGVQQVNDATADHLDSVVIDALYASPLLRAIRTVEIIAERKRNRQRMFGTQLPIASYDEFSFIGLPENKHGYSRLEAMKESGLVPSVGDVHRLMSDYFYAATDRLSRGLEAVVRELEAKQQQVAVVASHSPLCELMTRDSTPLLGLAGIIRYNFSIENGTVYIEPPEVVFTGYPE